MKKIVVFILFILHAMTFSKNLIVKDGETISSRFLVPSEYRESIIQKILLVLI